jgi:hypothetical protein
MQCRSGYDASTGPLAKEGDVVIVFSNEGFDGIHAKLLE